MQLTPIIVLLIKVFWSTNLRHVCMAVFISDFPFLCSEFNSFVSFQRLLKINLENNGITTAVFLTHRHAKIRLCLCLNDCNYSKKCCCYWIIVLFCWYFPHYVAKTVVFHCTSLLEVQFYPVRHCYSRGFRVYEFQPILDLLLFSLTRKLSVTIFCYMKKYSYRYMINRS